MAVMKKYHISRILVIALVIISLVAYSCYTAPKAYAEAFTLTSLFLMLVMSVMASLGVTLLSNALQSGIDYLHDQYLDFVSTKGFSNIEDYLISAGITSVVKLATPIFGAINIGKTVYDMISEFCSWFFSEKEIVSGGDPVGEVPSPVTATYSNVNTSRFSFDSDTLTLVGASANNYYISSGSLGGVFVPLSGWLSSGDTLDITLPDMSVIFTSSFTSGSSSATYYNNSVGYFIAQFVDTTSLVGGTSSSGNPHIHAGTNIQGVTSSDFYKSYYESYVVPHGNRYVGYYNSSVTASSGFRTRSYGTYSISVPDGAMYLFLGLGCGNYSSGQGINGVAVSTNRSVTLSKSASNGGGFYVDPSDDVISPPSVAVGQSYSISSVDTRPEDDVETAIFDVVAPLTSTGGLSKTATVTGTAVPAEWAWLYEGVESIKNNTSDDRHGSDFIPSSTTMDFGFWHYVPDWIDSVGAGFSMLVGVVTSLPSIMLAPLYGILVLGIVVALFHKLWGS